MSALQTDALAGRAWRPGAMAAMPRGRVARVAAFYIGIPGVFALYASLNNWQLVSDAGAPAAFFFYLGHALIPWSASALVTHAVMLALRRWQPGLVTLTVTGGFIAGLLVIPYAVWLTRTLTSDTATLAAAGIDAPSGIAIYLLRSMVVWVAVNMVFDRYLGYPRYRYASTGVPAPDAASGDSPVMPLLNRLERPVPVTDILALQAEQHYLRVFSTHGRELVHYRLRDAVRELPQDIGQQVHRSWWVANSAITALNSSGRRMELKLCNGVTVPVSTRYQELARRLAAGIAARH